VTDFPAPMQLPTPEPPRQQPQMMVPFLLAESTRMFLNFLATDSKLPESQRVVIGDYLMAHNQRLAQHLIANYGYEGFRTADGIAKAMRQQFIQTIADDQNAKESELFDILEREMKDFDGNASD
jgi:hypothetical protein